MKSCSTSKVIFMTMFCLLLSTSVFSKDVLPTKIALAVPQNCEMVLGDSRVIDVLFYSKHNSLTDTHYEPVTKRGLIWHTTPGNIVSIDAYGRLETLKTGVVRITAISTENSHVLASATIHVVKKPTVKPTYIKPQVNYTKKPAAVFQNLQKVVTRFSNSDALSNKAVPTQVKNIVKKTHSLNNSHRFDTVSQKAITWEIKPFADGSDGKFILRTNHALAAKNPDKLQYFMGDRYLPGDGKSPVAIISDNHAGIWVVDTLGNTTHIGMEKMTYTKKADIMVANTDKYVLRMGLASDARFDGSKWVPAISDNDGLWTSMFDTGELMRYAVLKKAHASSQEIAKARESALKSLKACLLLANISGRTTVVDSKIHYMTNTFLGAGNQYSPEYLKSGKILALDDYVGSPADTVSAHGIDAGKTTEGQYVGGSYKFSNEALNPSDWSTSGSAATTKRTLKGFIARSFCVPSAEDVPYGDGLFIQRNTDALGNPDVTGQYQKVLSGAGKLVGYTSDDHPILKVGNSKIPKILSDVTTLNGKTYSATELAYKGDTSTDELIGHLTVYKTAYDVLDKHNKEENALRNLTVQTVVRLAQHYIDNGYSLVDITGEGTTWGKTTRNYFNNDFTLEDNSLNSLVLLCTFKLAYYMTGEKKWQDEYLLLTTKKPYDYGKLVSSYWKHWMWVGENIDYKPSENLYQLSSSANKAEQSRHALYCLNHSDEEMAMLGYYLLFQMETDKTILKQYKKGLNGWWQSCQFSENPLWYYIYQLAYPNTEKNDGFGNSLVQTASWSLSRHPIDTREFQGYFDGSRSDVLDDNGNSISPNTVIGTRTSLTDAENADEPTNYKLDPTYNPHNIYQIKTLPADERSMHKFNNTTFTRISANNANDYEPATTYTLPYWFGRYHHMLSGGGLQ